jgi:signal transduction histidine kinase
MLGKNESGALFGAAAADDRDRPGGGLSLRGKAFLAFALVVAYVVAIGALLAYERSRMFTIVDNLERVHQQEELLARVNAAMANAILQVNEAYFLGYDPKSRDVVLSVEAVQAGLYALSKFDESCVAEAARLEPLLALLLRERARDALIDLRRTMYEQVRKLEGITQGVAAEKTRLHASYSLNYDALSLTIAGFGLLGLVVFGSVVALFFTRIAWDLKRLQGRAIEIVKGYRGSPLPVTRGDEVGSLMASVNQMQAEIAARELRLEFASAERMHQEKMAAVGSLAASIAHEINNPIAAITGVAEQIADTSRERECPHHGAACRPHLILEHARRVATITRQIALFSAPTSPHSELIDLNGLVESTCNFVRYDPRYRAIELVTELDRQLPAVEAVADHLTQILMNLLVNAADALQDVTDRARRVCVRTARHDGAIELAIIDNGVGMAPDVLVRAFDEHFTTKPRGKGSGLGLAMCRRLIERRGGHIDVESEPSCGTTVRVHIPLVTPQRIELVQVERSVHASADH